LRSAKEQFAAMYRSTIDRIREKLDRPASSAPSGSDGRIRVGFVITPGKEGVFLRSIQGVIERLDAERFAPSIVCWQPSVGLLEQAFQRPSSSFVVLPTAWKPLTEMLLTEAFDILYYFEIGTDSANYFLPFFRLAPVQCTSWGIQVTSGIPNVDHYLSCQLVEPSDAADHYSENLALAETMLCYRTRTPLPHAPKSREQFGFTPSQNLYVCAQQLGKFHTDFDPLIARILRQDEHGVLAITSDRSGNAACRLRERFAVTMPDVAGRVILLPHLERDEYRSLLLAADVLLDPPHFGGVNTTYDGLSYGKPIVTLPSGFHRGRYTLGCYRKLQLEDCVASSVEDYVQLAGRLARERDYRDFLSQRIHNASPALFEDAAAVSEHERLFEEFVTSKRRD
jgi:predicted O-linked N-acetylglucosamine transferase (SPINDLY family)